MEFGFGTSMFFVNGKVQGKAELKSLPDGTPVARFVISVCVEEGRTESLPIAVWGELAEKAACLLYGGARASVMGSIIERDGAVTLAGRKIDFIDTGDAKKKEKKAEAKNLAEDGDEEDENDDSDDLDFFKSNNGNNESGDEDSGEDESYDEYDDDDDDAFPF